MRVTLSMIRPELRTAGALFRFFVPAFTPRMFRLAGVLIRPMKGRCRSRKLRYGQVFIPRADGSRLRLCVYSPPAPRPDVPGLLWMHSGGYALGAPEQEEALIRRFIETSGCAVAAPDYRLSLDAPYPAALEDCYAALLWLKEHGGEYGVRADQLMVGGCSAGGGLAAALALYARDKGEVAVAFQMPLYPMLDDRMRTASMTDNDAPAWNARSNDAGWRLYLGDLFGGPQVPDYAAPARAANLSGLPPACTFVGGVDPFCDETTAYFDRLRESGTPARVRVFEGCFHGFDVICPRSRAAREATAFLMNCFRSAIEHDFARQPGCAHAQSF